MEIWRKANSVAFGLMMKNVHGWRNLIEIMDISMWKKKILNTGMIFKRISANIVSLQKLLHYLKRLNKVSVLASNLIFFKLIL